VVDVEHSHASKRYDISDQYVKSVLKGVRYSIPAMNRA
jgi:hypothetical protein